MHVYIFACWVTTMPPCQPLSVPAAPSLARLSVLNVIPLKLIPHQLMRTESQKRHKPVPLTLLPL